ncbi:hypothetical protein [Demequina sp. NBRC 110051]|uniref:hypothetical protein n=1 Tax=Demequina sp. NBRC 110051 TaxID=1570340 RepID=UPI000A0116D0|nr:hypothetical protein [Demequina sp. NBRC 110051]
MTTTPAEWVDPREQIEFSVRMASGRLAPRTFTDEAEARAWARPEEGDEVVSFNYVCACDR